MSFFEKLFHASEKYVKAKGSLFCSAVIVAAGSASRMKGTDKIMALLDGEPVICHTIRAFETSPSVKEIIIVTREELLAEINELCRKKFFSKVSAVTVGGSSRLESVLSGIKQISPDATHTAIHDGARPFVSAAVIERTIRKAVQTCAAAPALPVKDTIKTARGSIVMGTPKRSELFAVQTPQIFDRDLLSGALQKAQTEKWDVTDDCSAVERFGMTVHLVEGNEENIKITTPIDLVVAETLLERSRTSL